MERTRADSYRTAAKMATTVAVALMPAMWQGLMPIFAPLAIGTFSILAAYSFWRAHAEDRGMEQEVPNSTGGENSPSQHSSRTVPRTLVIHRVLSTVSVLESRRLVRKIASNRVARVKRLNREWSNRHRCGLATSVGRTIRARPYIAPFAAR
jgi:hypothetical protein